MPFTLTLPKLSPTMTDGTIVKWHKKEGDHVEAGDVLIEVATDKATVEFEAVDEGYLRKILIGEDGEAVVNQPIAIFTEKKSESIKGYEPEGAAVEEEEVVVEEKAVEAPKPAEGPVTGGMRQPAFTPEEPLENYTFEYPISATEKRLKASPVAKKIAKEKGLDLSTVKGTGPGGRIVKADLDKAQPSGIAVFGKQELPTEKPGAFEEIKLSPMRKAIANRLQEAKTFIPHFYVTQDIDVEAMIAIRDQLKKSDVKVTYNDFVVRACALALKEHPVINSGFNTVNQTISQFKTIDISIAVSMDEGLITPIVRHADYKNIGQISVEVKDLAKRARDGDLEPHEYKGGSFTVSNLGMYGITDFQAIINPPQGAILSVSGIREVPVVKDGEIVPGKLMRMTLSSDHRVIDGAAAAEFMVTVQRLLENPAVLLI